VSSAELDRELSLRLKAAALSTAFHAGSADEPRHKTIADELSQLAGETPGESIALSALLEPFVRVADAQALGSLAERAARAATELLTAGLRDGRAHFLLIALRWTDRLDAAARLTSEWFAIACRQGSQEAFAAASLHSSNLNRTRGRLREAEADAAAAIAAATPGDVNFVMSTVALTDCLLSKGDVAAAEDAFRAIGFGEEIPAFTTPSGTTRSSQRNSTTRSRPPAAGEPTRRSAQCSAYEVDYPPIQPTRSSSCSPPSNTSNVPRGDSNTPARSSTSEALSAARATEATRASHSALAMSSLASAELTAWLTPPAKSSQPAA
jgi:hypothetical protein